MALRMSDINMNFLPIIEIEPQGKRYDMPPDYVYKQLIIHVRIWLLWKGSQTR